MTPPDGQSSNRLTNTVEVDSRFSQFCDSGDEKGDCVHRGSASNSSSHTTKEKNGGKASLPILKTIHIAEARNNLRRKCLMNMALQSRMPTIPQFISGHEFHLSQDEQGQLIELGRGRYGVVYLGAMNTDGRLLAVKMLFRKLNTSNEVFVEASLLQHLSTSQTCVCPPFHGIGVVKDRRYVQYCLVSDYIGDEEDHRPLFISDLVSKWRTTCTKSEVRRHCLQLLLNIVKTLHDVHKQGVIVNDIKVDNMLCQRQDDGSWRPFLIDFGIAHYGHYSTSCRSKTEEEIRQYTRRYPHVDPDTIRMGRVSKSTDIFGLGYLIYGMASHLNDPILMEIAEVCMLPESHRPTALELTALIHQEGG